MAAIAKVKADLHESEQRQSAENAAIRSDMKAARPSGLNLTA